MIVHKAYKYRLKEYAELLKILAKTAGCCRWVWNRALSLQKQRLDDGSFEDKQQWRGGKVVVVPSQHTSQECPECHYVCKENRRTQSLFQCVN